MTALFIVIGILAFVFLLLICPLSILIKYDNEAEVKVRYLFLTFKFIPRKEKKKKPKKNKPEKPTEKTEEKQKKPIGGFIKQKGIGGLVELLKEICEILMRFTSSFTKHLVISRLDVDITIVGDDAADTAMKFGYVCSAVYPLISFIDNHVKKCRHSENIVPGFNDSKTKISLNIKARIKPLFLTGICIATVFRWFKAIAK